MKSQAVVQYSNSLDLNKNFAGTYVSNLSALTIGAEVVIISTENVQQRAPQRVGEKGFIKEVPVHPTTWFKVEFADGKCLAFRPSALLPIKGASRYPPTSFEGRKSSILDPSDILSAGAIFKPRELCEVTSSHKSTSGKQGELLDSSPELPKCKVLNLDLCEKESARNNVSSTTSTLKNSFDHGSLCRMNWKRSRSDSGLTDIETLSPKIGTHDCAAMPTREFCLNEDVTDFTGDWQLPAAVASSYCK